MRHADRLSLIPTTSPGSKNCLQASKSSVGTSELAHSAVDHLLDRLGLVGTRDHAAGV